MNTFGNLFRISILGESHGPCTGVVIDGVRPGLELSEKDFEADIARRKSGAQGTTSRIEPDIPEIVSGVYEGYTTGAPLTILFRNTNTRSGDYSSFTEHPRPGHADFTAMLKYQGYNDPRGGGHFSGRLTLPLVAAGVVAKKLLSDTVLTLSRGRVDYDPEAQIVELGGLSDPDAWPEALKAAQSEGDSLGAVVECRITGVPAGLGEPFWDSVESAVSHAIFAIPGVRGIEFGDGFAAARMKGSEHNDPFPGDEAPKEGCCHGEGHEGGCCHEAEGSGEHHCCHGEGHEGGCCHGEDGSGEHHCHHGEDGSEENHCCGHRRRLMPPLTNHAGGVNGGITNGNPLVFRVAFKPTSSIAKTGIPGRHDTCFALRTPVIVEAMASIVLADLLSRG